MPYMPELLPVYGLCHVYFTSCLIHCMLINRSDLTICSLSSDHYIEGKKTVKKEKKSSTEACFTQQIKV